MHVDCIKVKIISLSTSLSKWVYIFSVIIRQGKWVD